MRQVALFVVFVVSVVCAKPEVSRIIERFDSREDTTRMVAFYELLELSKAGQPPATDFRSSTLQWAKFARERNDVALAAIRLLERENRMMFSEGGTDSEEISNYYGDLIGHVAALENPESVAALVGAITTGGLATNGLAALGDVAIPWLERLTRSADYEKRSAVMYALGAMLEGQRPTVSPSGLVKARTLLLAGLKDRHYSVRVAAIFALRAAREVDVSAAISHLAESDSARITIAGQTHFPVRAAAKRWLAETP